MKNKKIFIAGHNGMVGSAIYRLLKNEGYHNIIVASRSELDLTKQSDVFDFLRKHQPSYIFIAAAKVGGIHANNTYRAEFIYQNLMIGLNIIHSAYQLGISDLLFLGSSCIYPRACPQPILEEYLLSSSLEPTNEPYAIAKIASIKLCESFNRQYGTHYICAMPTNLYGVNDNYHLHNSHVIPALIRKCHEAKINNEPEVEIWGTGNPRREFLYVDDLAKACVRLMQDPGANGIYNVGAGEDLTIRELAEQVANVVEYKGVLKFNTEKPDGPPRKLLNIDRIKKLGWFPETSLEIGLELAYQDFLYQSKNKLRNTEISI